VDLGVDLRIPAPGGKAQLRELRSAEKSAAFRSCVQDVFAEIEFQKPLHGETVVSYSLRFAADARR
jgi:hypothetical protein